MARSRWCPCRPAQVGKDVTGRAWRRPRSRTAPESARSARQGCRVELVVADLRIAGGDGFDTLVPVRRGDRDAVGLVAEVRWRRGRFDASSKAKRTTRSTPTRSSPSPGWRTRARCLRTCGRRSTSTRLGVSRTTTKSISPGARGLPSARTSGERIPDQLARPQVDVLVELAAELSSEPHSET